MREVTVRLYRVGELTGKARERALEAGRKWLDRTFEPSELTADMRLRVEDEYGVKTEECFWSLSYCQGDGVAFYGRLDLAVLAAKNAEVRSIVARAADIDTTLSVTVRGRNSFYHHWNSMSVEVEDDSGYRYTGRDDYLVDTEATADLLVRELREEVQRVLKEASHAAEELGYETLEAEREDDAVAELLEANGWEFDEYGNEF